MTMACRPYQMILGTFAVIGTSSVVAQQPFPTASDQPQWTVISYVLGLPVDTTVFQTTSMIDLCDHSFSVVSDVGFGVDVVYFRNDGQRTLFRMSEDCDAREFLLYDLSLNVGDSTYVGWQMEQPSLDTTLAIVEAIDVVEYLGTPRRRYTVRIDRCPDGSEPSVFTQDQWIEGIGSVGHPFYSVNCLCDFCESAFVLQCADSLNVPTYRFPAGTTCGPITAVHGGPLSSDGLQVVLSDGSWSIQLPNGISTGVITVNDLKGAEVRRSSISGPTANISTKMLAPGSYVVSLMTSSGRWSVRAVVAP